MIRVEALTKTYGPLTAVDDLDLEVPPGRVTGLLGADGSGKTTILRIAVGLTEATRGGVRFDGSSYRDLVNPGRHVGVLLDAAALHPGRTGREALTLGARTMGLPRARVEEVLALVEVSDLEAARRVRDHAPDTVQRLGLAHALLGDPPVLLLDEPATALDPAGLRRLRDLLASHAARGGTVLLTGHVLDEVETLTDEIVVLDRGRVVARGGSRSLRAASGRPRTLVTSLDDERLALALDRAGLETAPDPGGLLVAAAPVEVGRVAQDAGVVLTGLNAAPTGLEQLLLELAAPRAGAHARADTGSAVPSDVGARA